MTRRLRLTFAAALFFTVLTEIAHATPITVADADFQTGSAGQGAGFLTAWVSTTGVTDQYNPYEYGGGNVWYTGANPATDPALGGAGYPGIQGEYLGYIYDQGTDVALSQTLSATLQAGTTYTLTVTVGDRSGSFPFNAFGGALIDLYAGSTLIGSATYATQTVGTFVNDTLTVDSSGVNPSLIGQALQIQLHTAATGSTDFENVSLNATSDGPASVPEPSTLVLMASAMAMGLIFSRRRAN